MQNLNSPNAFTTGYLIMGLESKIYNFAVHSLEIYMNWLDYSERKRVLFFSSTVTFVIEL